MKKISFVLIFVLIFACLPAAEASSKVNQADISKGLTALVDLLSASLVCNYSPMKISLPSTTVSTDKTTLLPQRISFFLADPADYVSSLGSSFGSAIPNFLSALINPSKQNSDPIVSAIYYAMANKDYTEGQYYVSGIITFLYPNGSTLKSLSETLRKKTQDAMSITIDLDIMGSALSEPLYVNGSFTISTNESGTGLIAKSDLYSINGVFYKGGVFQFTR